MHCENVEKLLKIGRTVFVSNSIRLDVSLAELFYLWQSDLSLDLSINKLLDQSVHYYVNSWDCPA
jgi:hypothetical protein